MADRRVRASHASAIEVDFDIHGVFAPVHTLAIMCFPDVSQRKPVAANIGIDLIAQVEKLLGEFLTRLPKIFGHEPPKRGMLEQFVAEIAQDEHHAKALLQIANDLAKEVALPGTEDMRAEMLLWTHFSRTGSEINLRRVLLDLVRQNVIEPGGGFSAAAQAPPLKEIEKAFAESIVGGPMAAGLVLIATIALRQQHKDLASKNIAYGVVSVVRSKSGKKFGVDLLKHAWTDWASISPLWAGVLAEAQCWHPQYLIDDQNVQQAMLEVFNSDTRLPRAFSYAKWFSDQATSGGSVRWSRPLMRIDEVIRFPASLGPKVPDLPVFARNDVLIGKGLFV